MEYALLVNRLNDFKYWKIKYTRIYFGNEFCPRLLPSKSEIDTVIEIMKQKGIYLTLVTSYADSRGLITIKKIINYLAERKVLDEIVVNDLGILNYALESRRLSCNIVVGRALSRKNVEFYLNKSYYKKRIQRIEFNHCHEIHSNGLSSQIGISLYYPYSVISTTRYCSIAGIKSNKKANHGIIRCAKECLVFGEFSVSNPILKKSMTLKGNSVFIKNHDNIENIIKDKDIDRLIFQPKIPL